MCPWKEADKIELLVEDVLAAAVALALAAGCLPRHFADAL